MKIRAVYLTTISLQIIAILACHAQAVPAPLNLKSPAENITVDGDIKEWGDSLHFYSPQERLSYGLANTKDTLYLAVKIYDRSEIARVLLAGLTFSIDPKGKKKETYSITYPLIVGAAPSSFSRPHLDNEDNISQADRDELRRERLTTLRGIKVTGFKDVEDEMITTSNTYGFKAAIDYDAAGNLIFEAAIPLKFFNAEDALKNSWAFNLKINGMQRPSPGTEGNKEGGEGSSGRRGGNGGGGGMGSGGRHGGGRHGGSEAASQSSEASELSRSIDFWGRFYLAK